MATAYDVHAFTCKLCTCSHTYTTEQSCMLSMHALFRPAARRAGPVYMDQIDMTHMYACIYVPPCTRFVRARAGDRTVGRHAGARPANRRTARRPAGRRHAHAGTCMHA
jgi:hypothetical protein